MMIKPTLGTTFFLKLKRVNFNMKLENVRMHPACNNYFEAAITSTGLKTVP